MNEIVIGPNEIVIGMLAVIMALLVCLLLRRPKSDDTGFLLLQNQIANSSTESIKLGNNIRDLLHEQLTDLTSSLTDTNATARQMLSVAEQLGHALGDKKRRGNLGEQSLELNIDAKRFRPAVSVPRRQDR